MDYCKSAVLERRNPQPAKAEGSERAAPEKVCRRTLTLGADSISSRLSDSTPKHISGIYHSPGELCASDRNSESDTCQGLKLAKLPITTLARKFLFAGVNSGKWCHAVGRTRRSLKTRADIGCRQIHSGYSGRAPSLALAEYAQ